MLKGLVRDDGSIDTRSNEQPAEITKNSRPESYYKSYDHYVSALTLVAGLEEKELSEIRDVSLGFVDSDGIRLDSSYDLEDIVDFYIDDDSITNGQELKDKIEEKIVEMDSSV